VALPTVEEQVAATKPALENAIRQHPGFLPGRFLEPSGTSAYARRPLFVDPKGRFSILVMVWEKGQGTPLHNHGGEWVVECLYEGRMKVTDYEMTDEQDGICQFEASQTEHAYPGDAGYRIPPHEHHILENDWDNKSVTIHVFGGLMQRCDIFEPIEGGYRKVVKEMSYTK
jgi:predicted metal-dependent enzyme (double-stranded beta helix superfamily)